MNTLVAGTLFESLLTSMFAGPAANEQEARAAREEAIALARQQAEQRAQQAAAQAKYEKMMQSYKPLDGAQGTAFKTLSNSDLALKTLDGDAETLAANARKPFDTPSDSIKPVPETTGSPTPFFGDTMPQAELQLLVHPENDPRVVDLRNAVSFVVESIKMDGEKLAARTEPYTDPNADAKTQPQYCKDLAAKLDRLVNRRQQFQKTVDLAQNQVDTWREANRNALWNAARDGLSVWTGKLLDRFIKRAQAAERLQRICTKNAAQMAQEGINLSEIKAKIERLRMFSSRGRVIEMTKDISDWQAFIKDGVSSLVTQLTASNREIEEMLEDPRLQKYFETEAPELKTLLDISEIAASNKVFGKWVARKMPIVAGVEFAMNELYNATDWIVSFRQITEANKINGRVLEAAKQLQRDIDDTYTAMSECP